MNRAQSSEFRRRAWLIIAVLATVASIAWGVWQGGRQRLVASALPTPPDLEGYPQAFADEVIAETRKASGWRSSIDALGVLAELYHANGFLSEARACYAVLLRLAPSEPRWAYRDAIIAAGYGDLDLAEERLVRVGKRESTYLPARLRLAEILLKKGRLDEARAVFAAVQRQEAGEPYSLLGLARCHIEREEWTAARETLERLIETTRGAMGQDLIVPVYERLGEAVKAEQIRGRSKAGAFRDMADPWMEELNERSFDPFQLAVAAGAANAHGEAEKAIRWLRRAVSLLPNDATLRFQLGLALMQSEQKAAAREQLERCTQLDPTFADGWAYLFGVLVSMGEAGRAQQALETGLAHCPESPGLHRMRAQQLAAAGRREEAVPHFRTSIRVRPTEADTYIELAMVLLKLGRVEEGVAEFHRALEAEPGHPMALATLTFQAIAAGDESGAREWLGRAVRQPRVPRKEIEGLSAAYRRAFGRAPSL